MKQKQFILLVNKANARIRNLEKTFGDDVWAVNKVRDMLSTEPIQGITKSGRISKKTYDPDAQERVINTINQFLGWETAKVRGIKKSMNKFRTNIVDKLSDGKVSDKDVNFIYNLYKDKTFASLKKEFRLDSDYWVVYEDAREKAQSEDDFLQMMQDYINYGNDRDVQEKLIKIYNKHFRKK